MPGTVPGTYKVLSKYFLHEQIIHAGQTRSGTGCTGREGYKGLGGEFGLGDKEGRCFLWLRSKEENQGIKLLDWEEKELVASMFSGKEERNPHFQLTNQFACIHQGRITKQFIFQTIII